MSLTKEGINRSTLNYWVFQARPDRFDLSMAIEVGSQDSWQVNQYTTEIKEHDIVYFYQSGAKAGMYGWGLTTSEPYSIGTADVARRRKQGKQKSSKSQLKTDVIYKARFKECLPKDVIKGRSEWAKHQLFTSRVVTRRLMNGVMSLGMM